MNTTHRRRATAAELRALRLDDAGEPLEPEMPPHPTRECLDAFCELTTLHRSGYCIRHYREHAAPADPTTCDVCGHSSTADPHPCAFETGCTCWYGNPCRMSTEHARQS